MFELNPRGHVAADPQITLVGLGHVFGPDARHQPDRHCKNQQQHRKHDTSSAKRLPQHRSVGRLDHRKDALGNNCQPVRQRIAFPRIPFGFLLLSSPVGRQHRSQRQAGKQGTGQSKTHHPGQLVQQHPGRPLNEDQGHKHDQGRQGTGHDRRPDLGRPIDGRLLDWFPVVAVTVD